MHKPELLTQAEQDVIENGWGDYDEWSYYGYVVFDREIYRNIDQLWSDNNNKRKEAMKQSGKPLSDQERAARWKVKLPAIFESIGLTRDEVAAITGGEPRRVVVAVVKEDKPRPTCLVCGQPVGQRTCRLDWRRRWASAR
jgi:hypothetical protein